MFLHTWHPSAIAFSAGSLTIHWYGITLALGAMAGLWLILHLARRHRIARDHVINLFLWVVPLGLLGARLYHVINEWGYYRLHANEILAIWNGGLAIHGGIIAGALVVWWYARQHRLNLWQLMDILAPGLALGQAIGRWGNYFNQELFGRPTDLPWGVPIDPIYRPETFQSAEFFHPTFLYESLGNLVIVVILVWLHRRSSRPGTVVLTYFILYSILRVMTESLRIDQTPIIWGTRLPIIVSTLIILGSLSLLIHRRFSHVRA